MNNPKNISIKSFLADRGINPITERGGYGMYQSPFREESIPSFKVDYNSNLWYDFGLGEGGSIIDLVAKLENCSIGEAFRKLENNENLPIINRHCNSERKESPLQIERVEPLQNQHLLNYLSKRGIDLEIAKHHCREVHYTNNGKNYYAIGFENNDGGWELRNEYFKGSSMPKSPTVIKGEKDDTLLFEGFIDMLSYLSIKKIVVPVVNICILNSVNNLRKTEDFLKTQHSIHSFLDNDEAGRKTLAQVQTLCKNVVDYSKLYANFKDINDYLRSHNQEPPKAKVEQPKRRGRRM